MIKTAKVIWLWNRLRCMSAGEIAYRIRQKLSAEFNRHGLFVATEVPAPDLSRCPSGWLHALPDVDVAAYCRDADDILGGHMRVFAMQDANLGEVPDWNRDPLTGVLAPLEYGKTLDYRDESKVGDIKYLWEPNRHLQLVRVAQAYALSGEQGYIDGLRLQLLSWLDQCPYQYGVNWTSSLELGIRLLNWSIIWRLVGGAESRLFDGEYGEEFRRRWLESIYQHQHFIAGHLSKYSSANNHLLGEYMGLFIGGLTWPCWDCSSKWMKTGREGFSREVLIQNADDGVNREQGIWYHHEVTDMMLLSSLLARADDIDFGSAYWQRLASMLDFIAALMDRSGNLPMLGDSDDAVMVRFAPGEINVYRSLIASGAVLFSRSDLASRADSSDDKTRWLFGDDATGEIERLARGDVLAEPVRDFPAGGYAVLGDRFGEPDELKLVVDDGPLGYLSLAAHGHADALSLTLSVAGREILIDPGTYAYHTQQLWRDYFRGTSAHNTVRIDREDQSVPGGNFMWNRHANCRRHELVTGGDMEYWEAEHDGYTRMQNPVIHRRRVELEKSNKLIRVIDTLSAKGRHDVEIFWHLSEACGVEISGGCAIVNNDNVKSRIDLVSSDWQPALFTGCEDPPLGWVSRGFDSKKPTSALCWAGEIHGDATLITEISIDIDR